MNIMNMHFQKSNVEDLARKLQKMCDDATFVNDLKAGADEYILGKYSWNDVASATIGLYKKVIAK